MNNDYPNDFNYPENSDRDFSRSESQQHSYSSKSKDPFKQKETQDFQKSSEEALKNILLHNLPSMVVGSKELLNQFQTALQNKAEKENKSLATVLKDIENNMTDEVNVLLFRTALDNALKISQFGYGQSINNEQPCNEISYGGKEYIYNKIPALTNTNNVSPSNAFIKFQSILGLGSGISVDLIHSGFSVIVAPATQSDLVTLQVSIFGAEKTLGYSTSGYYTSGTRGKIYEILKEFIEKKISAYTLDVQPEELFSHISLLDFDLLLIGILKASYDKFYVSRTCQYLLNPDLDSKPCSHTVEAILDPSKLVQISRSLLTDRMLHTLSKKGPKSVSVAEKNNYVEELNSRIDELRERKSMLKIELENGSGYEIHFTTPSIDSFLSKSQEWLARVEKKLDDLLESNTEIQQAKAKDAIEEITRISGISSSIKEIIAYNPEVRTVFNDNHSIMNILENNASSYDVFLLNLQDDLFDYSNKAPIAYVATPSYICPQCKNKHVDSNPVLSKENLIGLNVVDFFFSVIGYMKTQVRDHSLIV